MLQFWTSVDVSPGFQNQSASFTCVRALSPQIFKIVLKLGEKFVVQTLPSVSSWYSVFIVDLYPVIPNTDTFTVSARCARCAGLLIRL